MYLNPSATPISNFHNMAKEISSIAGLCLPHFTPNMFFWANTKVSKCRWWEEGRSKIVVKHNGLIRALPNSKNRGVQILCKAFISQIISEFEVYDSTSVTIPYQYLRSRAMQDVRRLTKSKHNPMRARMLINWLVV